MVGERARGMQPSIREYSPDHMTLGSRMIRGALISAFPVMSVWIVDSKYGGSDGTI